MGAASEYPKGFGTYVLLQPFAKGGMGEVYLAKHGGIAGLDRFCVLKKLRPDLTENSEYVGRFVDEARVVVQLSHANIANVFDVGRVRDEYYLAMEHIAGSTLRDVQNRVKLGDVALSPGVIVEVCKDALAALDYAHRLKHQKTGEPLNLVHRDVSPQNIMVSYEGEVKLIDFGLAASELKEEQTESRVVMGKVAYMSPEQSRGETPTAATDQFAMAVIIYELMAGERFYQDMSSYEIWQIVGRGTFEPRRWKTIDPELRSIIGRALNPDPTLRFEDCGELYDALSTWAAKHHPSATTRSTRRFMQQAFNDRVVEHERLFRSFSDVDVSQFTELPADTVSLMNPLLGEDLALPDSGPVFATHTEERPTPVAAGVTKAQDEQSKTASVALLTDHTDLENQRLLRAPVPEDTAQAIAAATLTRQPLVGIAVVLLLALVGAGAFLWQRSQDDGDSVESKVSSKEVAPQKVAPQKVALQKVAPQKVAKSEPSKRRRRRAKSAQEPSVTPAAKTSSKTKKSWEVWRKALSTCNHACASLYTRSWKRVVADPSTFEEPIKDCATRCAKK